MGILLGQSSVTATSAYLGVSDNSALELARNINILLEDNMKNKKKLSLNAYDIVSLRIHNH